MLAVLTGAAVQPAFLYARAGNWVVHCGPRMRFPRTRDRERDATAITAWLMAYHEAVVRRVPEQWVWWHKRWRTRPPGETVSS
jgi:KDO2-lipid IV(A) lauroyltransferase